MTKWTIYGSTEWHRLDADGWHTVQLFGMRAGDRVEVFIPEY